MARHIQLPFTLLALVLSSALAQDTTNSLDPTPTSDSSVPSHTDDAGQQSGPSNTSGLYSYYLIFIALIICIAGVAAYLTYKRKKKLGVFLQQSRESALQRDLNSWDPIRARRRYWQGRWRSADISHEEGLNEHGEAPPPYMPKTRDEESGPQSTSNEPAVPMQTLSREQAGLKPPDYMEVGVHSEEENRTSSASMPGGSHPLAASHSGN